MAEFRTCPSRDELQRLILNQLPDSTARTIQQHLDRCPKCRRVLEECINSDALLEAVRSRRDIASDPTRTIHLPVEWIRGAVLTWIRAHDTTQEGENGLPVSTADLKRLLDPPQSAEEMGRLADFRVLRVIGVGGMAVVFEAEDSHLKRHVALKLMHPAVAAKPGGLERFLREAQSAAKLKHEHVVTIYQVGRHGQTPFIALELLHGESLEEHLLRNGSLSVREVVRIGREIALGLAAAHARGLLHRDIKPANIWLEQPEPCLREDATRKSEPHSEPACIASGAGPSANGRHQAGKVKILDFGCTKTWSDESGATQLGLLVGTPSYMAPEQLTGKPVDPRADLFSLGCVLYRMAAGRRPFGGDDLLAVVRALALDEPAPLINLNPLVPRRLSDLVGKLLSKSPDDRPGSAQAVLAELQLIEQELSPQPVAEPTQAPPPTTDTAARRRRANNWLVGAAIGLCVLLPFVYYVYGAQLIRIVTNKGQIVLEIDDPSIGIAVKEQQVVLHDGQGQAEITLAAGEHELDVTVKQPSGDAKFRTKKFTLKHGGKKVIEVRQELAKVVALRTPASPKRPEFPSSNTLTKDLKSQVLATRDLDRRAASWVLSLGGTVIVRAGHPAQSVQVQAGQSLPASDFELTSVQLENDAMTDAGLEHLRDLEKLEELYLCGKQVTGATFDILDGLTELKTLIIRNCPVTDAALKHLQSLTKLEILSLDGIHLTDAGLVHLQALKNLHSLNINWAQVTGAGLARLEELPLEILYLRGNSVSDGDLVHLSRFKGLRILYLSGQPVTNAGLAQVKDLDRLQILELNSTQVTDAGLADLSVLKSLRHLNLEQTRVTDAGLAHLKELPQLEILKLDDTAITDDGLASLGELKNLKMLSLRRATHLSDAAIPHIAHLRKLLNVDLSDCRVSAKGVAALKSALPNLSITWSDPNRAAAKAVLVAGGTVEVRLQRVAAIRSVKSIGDLPSESFQVIAVSLVGAHPRFETLLAALSDPSVDGLISLNLSGTELTNSGLAHLRSLSRLSSLWLERTRATDVGLAHIAELRALRNLSLKDTAVGDAGIADLKSLAELRSLNLESTRVSNASLAQLGKLAELRALNLANTSVTDVGMDGLTGLKHLDELDLGRTQITDAGLSRLQGLTALTHLRLDGTRVTDDGLAQLRSLKNLQSLNLNWSPVADSRLANLESLTKLRALHIRATRVTDAGLKRLRNMTQLEMLSLSRLPLTDAGLAPLPGLKQLRWLDLGSTRVTDAGLTNLLTLTELRHLALNGTAVTDAGLARLEPLTKLDSLDLGEMQVTDAGLEHLRGFKNLGELYLKGARHVGDFGIPRLLRFPQLMTLDLRDTHVSAKGLAILKAALPRGAQITWSEPNDTAARAVLIVGGRVDIRVQGAAADRAAKVASELPCDSFQITRVSLAGVRQPLTAVFETLKKPGVDALAALDLSDTAIGDADLPSLQGLIHLRHLVLDGAPIEGPGLIHLQELPELQELSLGCPKLAELFLVELASLKKLEKLSLAKSLVSDEGVQRLAQLTHLKELDLSETKVTAAGLLQMQNSLPGCRILATASHH